MICRIVRSSLIGLTLPLDWSYWSGHFDHALASWSRWKRWSLEIKVGKINKRTKYRIEPGIEEKIDMYTTETSIEEVHNRDRLAPITWKNNKNVPRLGSVLNWWTTLLASSLRTALLDQKQNSYNNRHDNHDKSLDDVRSSYLRQNYASVLYYSCSHKGTGYHLPQIFQIVLFTQKEIFTIQSILKSFLCFGTT